MSNRLEGQVAVITGSGAGIGKATAEFFAEEGAKVVIVDVDVEGSESTVAAIKKKGGEAVFIKTDVSVEEECKQLADAVVEKYGKIDILINNAAVFVLKGLSASLDEWKKSFGVNVFGTVAVSKHISEKMKTQKYGSIVNIASISAYVAQPELSCYASTKATIVSLTRNMALDLAPFNIRVNSVSPGSVFTVASERHAKSINMPIDQFKQEQGALNFMKRMADAREIAAPILFLASKEASFITGSDLIVDGGYCAQ